MLLFDSHCHLQSTKFGADRADAIARARDAGVMRVLNLGTKLADSHEVVAIARETPGYIAAVGVHPGDLDAWSEEELKGLMELANSARDVVRVWGEIGLDYYWKKFDHDLQRRVFRRQLAVARELGLPVSMHCREANDDLIVDLRAEDGAKIGGVAHCFAGTIEHARAYVEMGLAIGVGGSCTYKGNDALRGVLKEIGLQHIVLETDSPYLPPMPHRGKRNEPAYLRNTAEFIAGLFEVSLEEVARVTTANVERVFRLES